MAFNQTEKQEKEYLKQIISFLKKVIGNTDASVKDHVDTLAEYKDYIWSNKDFGRIDFLEKKENSKVMPTYMASIPSMTRKVELPLSMTGEHPFRACSMTMN